jgi:hypothetical protein
MLRQGPVLEQVGTTKLHHSTIPTPADTTSCFSTGFQQWVVWLRLSLLLGLYGSFGVGWQDKVIRGWSSPEPLHGATGAWFWSKFFASQLGMQLARQVIKAHLVPFTDLDYFYMRRLATR